MSPLGSNPVTKELPVVLTPEMIAAIKNDPLTGVEDKDEWHKRLGWLICVYEVLMRHPAQA